MHPRWRNAHGALWSGVGALAGAVCFASVAWNLVGTRVVAQSPPRPPGWDEASHGARVPPDYAGLFAMDRVHELHIVLTPDDYRAMQADLATVTILGPRRGGPPGPGGVPAADPANPPASVTAFLEASKAACSAKAASAPCAIQGADGQCTASPPGGELRCVPGARGNAGRPGGPNFATRDPIFVPATVRHGSNVWTKVGMRFKGNSSLMAARGSGAGKVPFRLDFDRYEDDVPAISNQRFYGFETLTFSSNYSDDSQLREVLATEIFRDRGVPSARAAFYRVFVDAGAGSEYWGLYTMIEDPADGAMLDAQFGGKGGNLYKPEGPGANWTMFVVEGFERKTNKDKADYSDILGAISALHAPRTDPSRWRAGLETRFDVDLFLRWLAVNTAIDNWDTYGAMPHNYYLYADPARGGRLTWIPWDHNMSFGRGRGGRVGAPVGAVPFVPPPLPPPAAAGVEVRRPIPIPPGDLAALVAANNFVLGRGIQINQGGVATILHEQVGDGWPLIRSLLSDEVYAARYRELLEHALGGLYSPEAIEKRARQLHALIAPFVVGDQGERTTHTTVSSKAAFEEALDGPGGLLERIRRRHDAVREALAQAKAR